MTPTFVLNARRGKTSKNTRNFIVSRDDGLCRYCERGVCYDGSAPSLQAAIDHFIPQVRGGSNKVRNKVLACIRCDSAKGLLTGDEFLAIISAHGGWGDGEPRGHLRINAIKKVCKEENARLQRALMRARNVAATTLSQLCDLA